MTEQGANCPEFEGVLTEVVKERDFVVFRPWRLGRNENEMTWTARTVERLAEEYGLERGLVYDKLTAALNTRQTRNKRRLFQHIPALLLLFYHYVLKRFVARNIVRPVLRRRHTGPGEERTRTSFHLVPHAPVGDTAPAASIVVLSYNRLAYLRSTLESLFATTPRNEFELIVVDNGSTDGSADALRRLAEGGVVDKLILRKNNHGTSAGFNIGFAYAEPSSRYLMKLDSDIKLLTPGWLTRFDAFFERVADVGILALYQVNVPPLMVAPRDRVGGESVISWNWHIIGSACMTIPRSVFQQLGYFCEDFKVKYILDDVDYAKRLFLLERRAYYLCGTRSYHRFDLNEDFKDLEKQKKRELPKSKERQKKICREYVIGTREIGIFYPQYEDCVFPRGQSVIEIH